MKRQSLMPLLAIVLLVGCASSESAKDANDDLVPRTEESSIGGIETRATRIAHIALEIRADAAATDAILAKHGFTREEFEAELYAISSDPQMAAIYNRVMESSN